MTYRGVVKKGVVVLEKGKLKEGTRVRVQPIPVKNGKPRRRKSQRLRRVGSWEGPPGEFERLLAEVQQMRDADLLY
ncbi:MAG TPA: hypothetical protein VGP94_11085 [Tepidisphaeraceae bacterium]|jgi:hypothetical protein|nr:hypothetical protein [Tepidisphaeraceae bacterium]